MQRTLDQPKSTLPPTLTVYTAVHRHKCRTFKVLRVNERWQSFVVEDPGNPRDQFTVVLTIQMRRALMDYRKRYEPGMRDEDLPGLLIRGSAEKRYGRVDSVYRWEILGRE